MDPVALDAGGYTGTYKLVGGRPSLDLVNTISWPGTERHHDWLDRPANAVARADATGLLGAAASDTIRAHDADPHGAGVTVGRLRSVRRELADVLTPLAHQNRPVAPAVDRFNRRLSVAGSRRRIDITALSWTWGPIRSLDDLHDVVVYDAADLIADGDLTRLGHCPSCDWLFYDHTRNRSRRWCDMADCGSRDKALRYYHRRRTR